MKKNFLNTYIFKPKRKADPLIHQISDTLELLSLADRRFNFETNEDLLDSYAYDILSLKARYRYLLKEARERGAKGGEIQNFERVGSSEERGLTE